MKSLPLFYFPMSILFIDDDKLLLSSFEMAAKNIPNKVITSESPISPDRIKTLKDFIQKILVKANDSEDFEIAYDKLEQQIFCHDDYVSTIVSDYSMPTTNGLDYFKSLDDSFDNVINKILLTGELDLSSAIDALNNKEIDYFSLKSSSKDIYSIIRRMEYNLFSSVTMNYSPNERFKDKEYIEIIDKEINKIKFKFFYVLNKSGGYKLISENDEKYIITIYSNEELRMYSELFNVDLAILEKSIPTYDSLEKGELKLIEAETSGNYKINVRIV